LFLKLHSVAKLLVPAKPRQSITQSDSGAEP